MWSQLLSIWVIVSQVGVVDNSLPLYPGVSSSIPGSPSLSDETLSCDLWGGLNQNHYQWRLGVLLDI